MDKERAVLVLSDSVLSSLGSCFENALDCFCKKLSYDIPLRFCNPSAAGMTSADAYANFVELAKRRRFDALILSVGNCDASAYGFQKPKTLFRHRGFHARMRNALYKRRNPLARGKHPLQFVIYDIAANRLRECVSPRDCETFISLIIAHAAKRSIPVILLNPVSKAYFPPCNTMGNSLFYKVVNVHDDHPYRGGEAARALTDALSLHGAGALHEALDAYRELEHVRGNDELRSIAANNAGAVYAEWKDYEAALSSLDRVSPIRNALYPIVLFNKAVISMIAGDETEARKYFLASFDQDRGTYRISRAHRDAVKRVSGRGGSLVYTIDAAEILSDSDFVDYCHPGEAGHARLCGMLQPALESALHLGSGPCKPRIEYVPLNPDRYAGARSNFFEHFGIVAATDGAFCRRISADAEAMPYERIVDAAFPFQDDPQSRARATILAHPLFGCAAFLRLSPPDVPADQGLLPELYFLRHMIPIYERMKSDESFHRRLEGSRELVPKFEKIMVWWDSLARYAGHTDARRLAGIYSCLDAEEVLRRTVHLLRRTISREPVAADKYRTTALWWFRESLIFGSASHYSMLFDRLSLLHVIDTCLFVLRHAEPGSETVRPFERVLAIVDRVMLVHRTFLAPVADRFYLFPEERRERYRAELESILRSEEFSALSEGFGGCSRSDAAR
jgi:tetratricopeptide (TPR) repeat protein